MKEARARGDTALDPEQLEKLRQRYDEAAAFGIDAIRAALKGNPGYRHSPHWPDVRLRVTRKWRLWEPARDRIQVCGQQSERRFITRTFA